MPAALTYGFTGGFYVGAGLLFTAAVVVFMIRVRADAVKEDDEAPVHMGSAVAVAVARASASVRVGSRRSRLHLLVGGPATGQQMESSV